MRKIALVLAGKPRAASSLLVRAYATAFKRFRRIEQGQDFNAWMERILRETDRKIDRVAA